MTESLLIQKDIYGEEVVRISCGEQCIVYRAENETGEGVMTCHSVFDGVEVIYNDFHMERWAHNKRPVENVLEINHCREGRFECEFPNGRCAFLEEGDLAVNLITNLPRASSFPLQHYHGISVVIDLDRAAAGAGMLLRDLSVDPCAISERLCAKNNCFIMRETKSIRHIFSELYTVPEDIRLGYMKLKVLELLLFLSAVSPDVRHDAALYHRRAHVDKVKAIRNDLIAHPQDNLSIDQLAEKYQIQPTTLKRCFRAIYGVPVHTFIQGYRLQLAARLLKESGERIADIANRVGYANPSKFSAAFKAAHHMTPSEYRNHA